MSSPARAIEEARRHSGRSPLWVARSLPAEVRAVCGEDVHEFPAVGGRTVWHRAGFPAPAALVGASPNAFGVLEDDAEARRIADELGAVYVETGGGVGPHPAMTRIRHRLGQLRGVHVAFDAPFAEHVTVLLPGDPKPVFGSLLAAGYRSARILSDRYPELPGGLLVPVPQDGYDETLEIVERALRVAEVR